MLSSSLTDISVFWCPATSLTDRSGNFSVEHVDSLRCQTNWVYKLFHALLINNSLAQWQGFTV